MTAPIKFTLYVRRNLPGVQALTVINLTTTPGLVEPFPWEKDYFQRYWTIDSITAKV